MSSTATATRGSTPALLHAIACATLLEFSVCMAKHRWTHATKINNRHVFERSLFVVLDRLRLRTALTLPVQAQFDAPTIVDWLHLPTVETVLSQCVTATWIVDVSSATGPNYTLSVAGENIARTFTEDPENVTAVNVVADSLTELSYKHFDLAAIKDIVLEIAVDVNRSSTPYPYYRTDSVALAPFLRGAMARA